MAAIGGVEGELDRLYRNRFPASERASKARLWKELCDSFFNRYVPSDGTVLDLGAGYCDFINHARAARRIAVDLNPDCLAASEPDVEAHQLPLDHLGEVVGDGSLDVAFASNVFEHLRGSDMLLDILKSVYVALKPGGRLLIMQPNIRYVGAAFWDFFDHSLPLTEKGMTEALRLVGFEVEECRPKFLPYTSNNPFPRWPWIVRLYLALPAAQWLFGKQFFIVARRPS
jgi:SAM-dependent methyltransferase